MSQYVVRQCRCRTALGGQGWMSRLLERMLARRSGRPSFVRLSDHLLRDAGLERAGGTVRHRVR